MKVLIFTHKNDIDGMGNAILANLAFNEVDYILCGTFNLTELVNRYYEDNTIYDYDRIYVTDLCLEEPILSKVASDTKLKGKIRVFDHHKTFLDPKYTSHDFIKVQLEDEHGLCCGTSLFYQHLISEGLLDNNQALQEFVELTRQHDTWEWRNIYNNEKARELSILFDSLGTKGYIELMTKKLSNPMVKTFEYDELETMLIMNRKALIEEKCKYYADRIFYREILGLKAGIIFINYEFRNEIAEYFRKNNFDMDFAMMVAIDEGTVSYRSVKDGVFVRPVAEHFGGKGHEKAATNPITMDVQKEIVKVLTKSNE